MNRTRPQLCAIRCTSCLVVFLALAGVARAQVQFPGTVARRSMMEGRVISTNNEPIRGVTLVLVDFNGASRRMAMTDDSGTFVFADLRAGVYEIQASMPGFQARSIRLDHDGERDYSVRIVLEPRTAASETASAPLTAVWALRIPAAALEEYNRGIEQLKQKQPKQARVHFAKATELYPDYATAHAALGSLALGEKDPKAAQSAFERSLAIDDNLLDAQLGMASIAIEAKRFAYARVYLLKARTLKPDDWRILHQLGETEWQLGWDAEAEVSLRRAVELNADSPRTLLLLINVLALQEKLPEALAAMEEFLRLFPKNSFAPQVREKRDKLKKQIGAVFQIPEGALRG